MVFEKEANSSSKRLRPPPPTEETPLLGPPKLQSSQAKTFANVFIAIVGAGVLGMPYSFKRTGWIMSLLTLFFVAYLTHHCMMLLVYTRRKLESSDTETKIPSFGDLGFSVCGTWGRLVVDVLIILAQIGFCVGYLLFIGNTMTHLINPVTSTNLSPKIMELAPKSFYIWACFPFQLGLNSIRTLTHMAPLSIFADVVDLGSMGVVIIEDLTIMMKGVDFGGLKSFGDVSMFFYALGVSVYSFEGVGMVLPLESEARDKEKFGRVLGFTMVFIALMYGCFGAFGYFAFGEQTRDLITANLGKGVISTLVKLGLVINLFFTLPIMMNPVYEIVERRLWSGRFCLWLRWLLVLVVCLVALLVPNFADFMALVGSGVCCVLGFVLPSMFHLLVFKGEMGWKQWLSDVSILALGIILGISGTWFALQEIFSHKVYDISYLSNGHQL